MKRTFTKLIAALALLVFMTPTMAGWGQTKTDPEVTFSYTAYNGQGTSGTGSQCSADIDDISITSTKAYCASNHVKEYSGSEITFSSTAGNIHSIAITTSQNVNNVGLKSGQPGSISISGNVATWTGDAASVILWNKGSGQFRWTSIKVTYASSGGSTDYTLTYKANNGSAIADVTETVTSGGSTTLKPSNTFSFEGHTFYKWNTDANGTGTDYNAGTTLSNITSDYTFFARWNYNVAIETVTGTTITATYNNNNLTGNANAVPRGAQITLAHGEIAANQEFVWSILKSSDNSNVTASVLSGTTLTVPDYDIIIGGSVVQEDPSFEIVFAATNNGGNCQANEGSWNVSGGSLALSCAANSSSGKPAYNSSSSELRIYGNANGGGSITLTPTTVSITKVVLTASSGYANAVKYYINGTNTGTSLSWNGTTGTVDNINGYITFQNAENGTTQVRIKKIKIYYSVPETFTPDVSLNNSNYGTLSDPTDNVYTVTPNADCKIVDFTKTNDVTVEQLTGDAFSASTYRIIATAANQTVTFNLAQRTGATVTLHDGLNGSTTTAVNTYTDATLADVIEGHTIAPVNGWTAFGWVKGYTSEAPTLITTTETVGSTTDLYAIYKKGSNTFQRITADSGLEVNATYMICYNSGTTYKFINGEDSNNSGYMAYTDANTVSENSFEYVSGEKFVLGGSAGAYTFIDGTKYLTGSEGAQGLSLSTTLDDYGKWMITMNTYAQIENKGNYNGGTNSYANRYVSYHTKNNYFNCYTSYSSIYLFKQITNDLQYSIAPTAELCHVYYNANGATTGNVPEDNTGYNPNTSVTILGNTGALAKTGYTWSGWCLNAEGTGAVYGPGYTTTYTLPENTAFYAKWVVNSHDWSTDLTNAVSGTTAQLKVNNTVVAANTQIAYGTEVTVEVAVPTGYIYSISVNNGAVSVNNNKFTMPDDNVTVVVTTEIDPYLTVSLTSDEMDDMTGDLQYGNIKTVTVGGLTWETNGQQVTERTYIQIRARSGNNEISYVKLPDLNGKIETIDLSVANGSGNAWSNTVYFNDAVTNDNNDYIVSFKGSTSTSVTLDLSSKFYSTGYLLANGTTRLLSITIKYRPYQDMTGTVLPTTIAEDQTVAISANTDATATDLTIPASSGIIIKSGASLTVSGTLTNSGTANNIIIEDGGQLVYYDNSAKDAVKATAQKIITGFGDDNTVKDGWYFIASPITSSVTPEEVTNLLGEALNTNPVTYNYDLYRLNNTAWENYHQHNDNENPFMLVNGQGYLYAKSSNTTLSFAGTIKPYNNNDNSVGTPSVWNLVGNPYTFNVYSSESYYKITTTNNVDAITAVTSSSDYIAPCTGIIVNGSVTFTDTEATWSTGAKGSVEMTLTNNGKRSAETLDNAIVSFKENSQLEKFYFGNPSANIYIPLNGKEYAIATCDMQGEMPVNFKAAEDGQYTISVNPEDVEMNYLHLIDNLTGADVDLLNTPSYTFNAKSDDYESRFRLVFSANNANTEDGNDDFAFISNGQIIINDNLSNATLQTVDMLGRVVNTQQVNGNTASMAPVANGVYVLHLINGNDVKTQKIVVR